MKIEFKGIKTYATAANAAKAVEKKGMSDYRHMIIQNESTNGRWFPVFIGNNEAIRAGIHFHFCVVN